MAISTNGLQLVRIAGAVFNQQLSAADYSEILAANKTAAELDAWANAAVAAEFRNKTTTDIAKAVLANVGLSTVAGLEAWVAAQLTAGGGVAKAGQTMLSLLNDYSNMSTTDATYGASVVTFNAKTAASQVLSQTAGTAGGTYAAVSSVVVNTALTLTSATQTSTGTAGDDTFTAAAGTWGTGDVVNGGAGTDTLNATVTGTAPTQSATSLVSIETLNLTASPNPSTLDLTGVTGLTSVNNISSANGATVSVSGLGNVVNTTITGGNTSTSIAYSTTGNAGTADAATLTLNGTTATSASGSSFTTAGVETLTVNSATSANSLKSLTDTGITKLNITGSQALTVFDAVGSTTIATVDASAATGAITLSTGNGAGGTAATGVTVTAPTAATAGLFTITTGNNKDTVTLGAGTSLVSTGSGADTINSGAGNTTIIPGAGNDVVNAGAGVDTIRFDAVAAATNSDTINNFGATDVLSINLGRAQVTGTSGAPASAVYGSLLTTNGVTATSPTFSGVSGTGTGTAIVFQSVAAGTATANTIAQATNVVALTGVFTDGTAAGAVSALGATGQGGVTTQLDSRFLLVTYSVGNIAQVWSYTGDVQTAATGTSVLTDIDAAELSLVATLNGVASGSLTAANFSTYLDVAAATATASSGTGQIINISTPLSQVTSTANTAGQFFTAAADTVNVAVGMLPNAAATTTAGLTLLDDAVGDGDVLNVTGLTAAALTDLTMGTFTSNIETINMNLLVGGGNFTASSKTPGTTTFGFTGTGGQTILGLPTTPTIKFDAGATNVVAGTMVAGPYSVALNGSGAAASTVTGQPTGPSLAMTNGTTATTTVTGTSVLLAQAGSLYGGTVASAQTITGTGNLTISGTGATFAALTGGVSTTGYTGALTLRPTDATAFDMSGTGADTTKFTGVRTIDFSQTTGAGAVVLASDNGAWTTTVTSNANMGALSITQAGSGLTDALTITQALTAGTITSIATPGIETLTVNLGGAAAGTTAKTLTSIQMDVNAGTQALTVTSNVPANLGTVTADSLNTTGVLGTLTAALGNNTLVGGATFTGSTTQASFITTGGYADIITTGSGNDAIYVPANSTVSSAVLNGGLGNDTYSIAATNSAGTVITDAGGTDTLVLTGATANISGMNGGATLATMGIDQLIVTGGSTVTVAGGQITGTLPVSLVTGTTAVNFTLGTPGVLNLSSLNLANTPAYLTNTGAAAAAGTAGVVTGALSTGSSGADSITGTTGNDTIAGGGGADVLVGGTGTNTYNFASAANLAAATVTGGAGTDIIAITGDAVTLVDANFTATHTLLEQLTLGTGTTSTTLGAAATAAGIATVNTGVGATTITSTQAALAVNPLAITTGVALTLSGSANYTVSQAGTAFDTLVATGSTGTIAATFGNDAGDAIAITAGNGNMTVTGGAAGDVITVTGLATAGQTFTGTVSAFNITAGAGSQTITTGAVASSVTGGAGADAITLGAANAVNDTVTIAAGAATVTIGGAGNAGTITGYDVVTNFALNGDILSTDGTTAASTLATGDAGASTLTNAAGATATSHVLVATGFYTLVSSAGGAFAVTDIPSLAAAVQYFALADFGSDGDTMAFAGTLGGVAQTFVIKQGANTMATYEMVQLVGITATGVATTAGAGLVTIL